MRNFCVEVYIFVKNIDFFFDNFLKIKIQIKLILTLFQIQYNFLLQNLKIIVLYFFGLFVFFNAYLRTEMLKFIFFPDHFAMSIIYLRTYI